MVIQIIPKQQDKSSVLINIFLYLSIVLFLLAGASYFVLNNLEQKTVNEIKSLDEELTKTNSSPEAALEKEILQYQKKINDFSSLLAAHRYSSQIFPLLEGATHPKTVFSTFSLDLDKKTISVTGFADSFQTLGQQIGIFKKESFLVSALLTEIALEKDDKVSFGFNLILNPQAFKKVEKNE